jgi:nitrate reductase gamma subunit
MLAIPEVPFLLALLVGLLLGLVVAGLLTNRAGATREAPARPRSDILSGMFVLAAFAMGVFVTYVLLGPR